MALPRVLLDAQPLPPPDRDHGGEPVDRDAPPQFPLCSAVQPPARARRASLPGQIPFGARGEQPSPDRAHSLHRAESGSRRSLRAPARVAVEQLSRGSAKSAAARRPPPPLAARPIWRPTGASLPRVAELRLSRPPPPR